MLSRFGLLLLVWFAAMQGESPGWAGPSPSGECPPDLESQRVIWTSPSTNAAGSMPIGNGELGLNVWVDPGGDLLFYLARTDAWSEVSRLLKLGRARVRVTPNPFVKGQPFRQELDLRNGRIVITGGDRENEVSLSVWVDPREPVVHVTGKSEKPVAVRATLESWRADTKHLAGDELLSSWTMQEAPAGTPISESADVVYAANERVVFYHRNEHSIVPFSLKLQGLESAAGVTPDPLLRRTFGGVMRGKGFRSAEAPAFPHGVSGSLVSRWPSREFALRIATHSAITDSAEEWLREVERVASRNENPAASLKRNTTHWNEFWDRSWLFVEAPASDKDSEGLQALTRGYTLQRWMTACASRGAFPIKFNGSLFTVEPEFSGGPKMNADWRRWGDCYWWQNTRLPYAPMLAHGDFESMRTLFRFYEQAVPLAQARTRLYHQAEGVYFPETITSFGTWANRDYGWARAGHQANEVLNPYIRHIWQPGLELVNLMLDYYDYTGDSKFLAREVLPLAREVLRYFETRFGNNPGMIRIEPTQSVETYWEGVVNDTPSVAGLHAVTQRLLALPESRLAREDRRRLLALRERLPALPVEEVDGVERIRPAELFNPRRNNIENPELYAVWPFRLYGLGRPDMDMAVASFHARQEKATAGWSYDSQCAALLGLKDEAARQLLIKARNSHPNHRFPAMWGPNYDWVPDQDHGASMMLTLQLMLLQNVGDRLILCPAWPKNWDASFKLHAPGGTTLQGTVRGGTLTQLEVQPATRVRDISIGSGIAVGTGISLRSVGTSQ